MSDHPITESVQDEAWALLNRLSEYWKPTLGYFSVGSNLFLEVILFLERQGIAIEPPPATEEQQDDDEFELTPAEEADMMQAAATALAQIIRAQVQGDN